MAKFKITDHETGKTVIVSGDAAPSDQEAEQIFADAGLRQSNQQAAPAEGPSAAVDMARSVPGGLAQGVSAMAGLPGDLRELGGAALDWISNKTGGDPQAGSNFKDAANKGFGGILAAVSGEPSLAGIPLPLPGSKEINDAVAKPFGGYYEPKTTAGKYAQTVASFAPNAISPGSLAAKAARVVVPGVASEGARQAVGEDSKWAPLAAAGGAVLGGMGVGAAEAALSKAPVMSMEELGKAKSANYKAAEDAGVIISPQSFQKFATDLGTDITKNNVVSPKLHPQTLAALESIQAEAATGVPLSLERADILRQEVIGAFENATSRDARLLTKVKNTLDHYLDNIPPTETLSGDASVAVPIMKQARALAQREFKAKKIQELVDLADNQASTNYSASGYEQALRAQFKNFNAKLIKDKGLAASFTEAERAAIKKVAEGGPVGNALRWAGKFSPNGSVQTNMAAGLGGTTAGGLGYLLSGGNPQVGVAAALAGQTAALGGGALARGGATYLTSRNARLAEELMRAGPNAANQGATAIPKNVLLGALLSQASN